MKILFFIFLSLVFCLSINNFCLAGYSDFDCDRALRRDFPVQVEWDGLSLGQREELARLDYGVGLSDRDKTDYQNGHEFLELPPEEQQEAYQYQWILRVNGSRTGVEDLITHVIRMPTGTAFERVLADEFFGHLGVTYVDVGTGLRWSSPLKETMNWYDADRACRELGSGSRLPTKEEYEDLVNKLGENSKGRLNALLPKHSITYFYWSSSVQPDNSNVAYFLYGDGGDIVYFNRSYGNGNAAVRCVRSSSRRGKLIL